MNRVNGAEAPAFAASSKDDRRAGAPSQAVRETSQRGMDSGHAPRRYSAGVDLSQRQNGEREMTMNYQTLASSGYSIIWTSGDYCQAIRGDRDVTFRWNGERWIEL